jgi:glycine dehydrogenase subunit 2
MSLHIEEKLIFELDNPGREGYSLPENDVPEVRAEEVLKGFERKEPVRGLPEVSEVDVIRHFTRLSTYNYAVDFGLYPLGSCTMKYNPKINEYVSRLEGLSCLHPLQDENNVQGALEILFELGESLKKISGMDGVTLQPAAGAHGEFTGMQLIRAYLNDKGDKRSVVLIPDSAHGTNPASAHFAGYKIEEIKSNADGCVDIDALKARMADDVAAIMLTVPNTLGIFEKNIKQICDILHDKGGQVYIDGANLNALMIKTRPGDWGADVMHINLHKTFSTPHGGGGPGSGPVVCKKHLIPFLPKPVLVKEGEKYHWDCDRPKSIGKVLAFFGNFLVCVRALAYIETLGEEGLKLVTERAVLNANYIRKKLEGVLDLPYKGKTLHEVIFSDKNMPNGITTMDIAKRLIDFGFHPPTVYFPLIVHGAIMIEPTETEPREEMDRFIETVKKVVEEAKTNPELLKEAPHNTYRRRLDEVAAARTPKINFFG